MGVSSHVPVPGLACPTLGLLDGSSQTKARKSSAWEYFGNNDIGMVLQWL